jgi:hypothetical protein
VDGGAGHRQAEARTVERRPPRLSAGRERGRPRRCAATHRSSGLVVSRQATKTAGLAGHPPVASMWWLSQMASGPCSRQRQIVVRVSETGIPYTYSFSLDFSFELCNCSKFD